MGSSFAVLAGAGMFAIVLMIVVGLALAGLVLMLAFRMVVGFTPAYLRALAAVLLTTLASAVVAVILRLAFHGGGSLLVAAAEFLVGAAVINFLLPAQDGQPIGYGKACLVQLVYFAMAVVLGIVFGLVLAMLFGGMLAGMH